MAGKGRVVVLAGAAMAATALVRTLEDVRERVGVVVVVAVLCVGWEAIPGRRRHVWRRRFLTCLLERA
eukprot:761600-Hanusia_phi.AAC.1